MDSSSTDTATTVTVDPRHVSYTHVMYALHATSVAIGLLSTAVIVKAFVFGAPSLLAVVMNYFRRTAVRGTWLDSHFRWQVRTFWFALVAFIVARLFFGPFAIILIGIPPLIVSYALIGIWVTWRVVRGWLALRDGRSVPNTIF